MRPGLPLRPASRGSGAAAATARATRRRRLLLALGLTLVMLAAAHGGAEAKPCDRHPDDPRCAGTTTTTTTTTTTEPPATTPPPPLGIVSGSNGDRYWNRAVTEYGLPSTTVSLGGGDTHRWGTAEDRRFETYWSIFDGHAATGAVVVWWYALARHTTTDEADAVAEADVIVAQILDLRPEATIYASPMAGYDPDTCSPANIAMSQHLVAHAIATYPQVTAGPEMPEVTTTTDGCHPGGESLDAGAAILSAWADELDRASER